MEVYITKNFDDEGLTLFTKRPRESYRTWICPDGEHYDLAENKSFSFLKKGQCAILEVKDIVDWTFESTKQRVQFISYDGVYPCLCSGTLTIRVGVKEYKIEDALVSGGDVVSDEDEGLIATEGPWELNEPRFPEELIPYFKEILECVNANVPHGCCGGCI